jgi:hypothetical protein
LAVGEWKEWRYAATSDVLKLRFVVSAVKLRRAALRRRAETIHMPSRVLFAVLAAGASW